MNKSAAASLLARRVREQCDGLVTGASAKGTWMNPATEGKVVSGFLSLNVCDRVRVKLVDTDVERGFMDFARTVAA